MKKILIFIFCLFIFNSCKRNEIDALPPVTQNGANTFGCLINGSAWVSTGKPASLSGSGTKRIEGGYEHNYSDTIRNNILLWAIKNDGTSMQFYIRRVNKPGIYNLLYNSGTFPAAFFPYNYGKFSDNSGTYITGINNTGKVIITKADTINNAIAGTFEFQGYNYDTKQTILITNGRFDFLYKP